ncbi:uncharacterized protein LOC124920810 [Impatiens glandulifera]|uniref:uncharacterized protein LOC124920810 n=1 Tax=Impatiens glandulifera TaxID=253017 RepID=UPI001FB18257|nr:uncharacterized protein LOC124920810 [Impatiens glandulifera]
MKLNSVLSPLSSSLPCLTPHRRSSFGLQPHLNLSSKYNNPSLSLSLRRTGSSPFSRLSRNVKSPIGAAAVPSREEEEAPSSAIHFQEIVEKDWSFLESEGTNFDRIISAGEIREDSRVLVCLGSEGFVDRVVENCSSPKLLLVVHESLFVLAGIKEMYDSVKCWQGEIIHVPSKWESFDVVFLYFLPASPLKLDQILQTISSRCSPGARIVISHPQGREALEEQRRQNPDVIVSQLPDKGTVEKVAGSCSFEMSEFVDEPGLYLAVLKFSSS